MNIIILADSLSTELGGIEKCLFETCLHLYRRGHHITLIYETPGDQLKYYEQFCQSIIHIKKFKLSPRLPGDLIKLLNVPADRIYSHYYDNFFFGVLLAKLKRVPFYAHLHLPAPIEINKLKWLKQSFTLANITHFFPVSKAVKEDWVKCLNVPENKFSIVYNGINLDRFIPSDHRTQLLKKWEIEDDVKVICYVGRLESYKGVDHLLRAFANLCQGNIKVKLLIAGKSIISGELYEEKLRQLVIQLGIQDHVTFLGHVAQPEEIYQISDVLVAPSLWLEAFGLVITEAMACQIPVVASRVGGIPEILSGEFQEYLFDSGDEKQLSSILNKILNWREDDPNLGQRCRKHVIENFDIDQNIDRIESLLSLGESKSSLKLTAKLI